MTKDNLSKAIVDLSVFLHREMSFSADFNTDKPIFDLTDVLSLDPFATLHLIKTQITALIQLKREARDQENSGIDQATLHRLESEIRTHVTNEKQLKLQITGLQREKEEELRVKYAKNREKLRSFDLEKRVGRLEAELILHKSTLHSVQKENKQLRKALRKAKTREIKENLCFSISALTKNHISGRSQSPLLQSSQSKLRSCLGSDPSQPRPLSASRLSPKPFL
jgi:hypothetical protein